MPNPFLNGKFIQYLTKRWRWKTLQKKKYRQESKRRPIEQAKQQLQYHLEQTRQQQGRLKGIISNPGGKPTSSRASGQWRIFGSIYLCISKHNRHKIGKCSIIPKLECYS
jgi:hypothetical protein